MNPLNRGPHHPQRPERAGSSTRGHAARHLRPGRPTKLTPRVATRVLDAVRKGATREVAAQAAGIGRSTLGIWHARGKDDLDAGLHSVFAAFAGDLSRAEADAELYLVDLLRKAAVSDPRSAQWLLARRWPERWAARTEAYAATGVDDPVIRVELKLED
jgi:hypothetical protein